MLLNLKRIYVHMRSFPQARDVTELLLAITPSALSELRDRGLLAYHLNDVTSALRDLQTYLKLSSMTELDSEAREEHEQIWEHVKTLRRRVQPIFQNPYGTLDPMYSIYRTIEEPLRLQARSLLVHRHDLVAPDILIAGVAELARQKTLSGEIAADQAVPIVRNIALPAFISTFVDSTRLRHRALAIALQCGRPVNDGLYAACAEEDVPIFVCTGVCGPRFPSLCQKTELIEEVVYFFPDLTFVLMDFRNNTRSATHPPSTCRACSPKMM